MSHSHLSHGSAWNVSSPGCDSWKCYGSNWTVETRPGVGWWCLGGSITIIITALLSRCCSGGNRLLQTAVMCLLTLFTWTVWAPWSWQRLSVNSVCLCVSVCVCVLFQIHSSSLTLDVSINHFWSLIYMFNWVVLVLKLLMSRLMSVCFGWRCFCFGNWVQGSFKLSPFWCLKNLFVQLLVAHVHFTILA